MFKRLQGKLVAIFVLLVLAIMMVTGTFLILSVSNFYHELFAEEMDLMFDSKFTEKLKTDKGDEEYLKNIVAAHTTVMGIDSYRNYFIVAEDGSVLDSSTDEIPASFGTPNFITALSGKIGREVSKQNEYMDYAVPIDSGGKTYIIYVIDTKEELMQIIQQIFAMIMQALFLGVVISVVLGYFLSKTITKPIANLTKKAKRMAEGEFENKIDDVSSEDEIGTLTTAFNDMSSQLQQTMLLMSTEKNKIEEILKNMTDGVVAFGVDGKVIHINPTAKKMFKIRSTENVEFDSFFSDIGANIKLGDLLYLEDIGITEREINFNNMIFNANFSVFEDELDKTRGVIVVLQDITKQQKLENSRREFVANVSHELRTPLTTVKSYAETLLEMEKDPTALSFTNTILSETDRMTRLVKDLLVLSSLDHFKGAVKNKFDMAELCRDVVETMQLVAKEQGHRLILTMKEKNLAFYGDRDKIEQLLYNIISNAIKYTPNGGRIEVICARVYNDIVIKVKDNGIGIPEKDLPRIFERFYRVDKARSRERGGTGLGLAISQGIVETHDGNISIDSVYKEGTVVTITLPVLTPSN